MLRIQITKRADGSGVLRCSRPDGSVTWQKQKDRHARFFALHDLTHFAVETELGYRQGFFGLIAAGWDIDETGGKGPRGALPAETVEVERIVGAFDAERAAGTPWTAEEFNQHLALEGWAPKRPLTAEDLLGIRTVRSRLFAQWSAVSPGESIELQFPT
ncbi:MAG TPA: hypothetical protein VKU01_17515 [Bryobacteraceae bacterium]|nr:hypothetical protein [Bryobacteraceae bacterium]